MRTARRRSTLAALTAGLILALLPTAADACDSRDHRPGHADRGTELTLVYVYKKVDATAPASWENSGEQRLIQMRDGLSWTDSIDVSLLPDDVCGPGWAVQEDQTRGLSRDAVPTLVDRRARIGVLTWPPIVAARHSELSELVPVPECAPVVPVEPPPTTPPATTPPATTPPPTTPPATTPPATTPPPTTPPATAPPTAPVVVEAAQAANPVVAAPAFAG